MKKLKPLDYELLYQLIRDSHRSDRQLAKALGISQPTVTRKRATLEESAFDGYTIIPKFGQIGYELATFTFLKTSLSHLKNTEQQEAFNKMHDWFAKQSNVILVADGQGLRYDAICVSLHQNYTDFANFLRDMESELHEVVAETRSFLVDLKPGVMIKPFHLKYLGGK